ncbi:MAG: TolC family protein [Pirellulaceae bacterium]
MNRSRHAFRILLVLTALGSSGCATSRELTSPTTRRTPWHSTVRNAQPAEPVESVKSAMRESAHDQATLPTQMTNVAAQPETSDTRFKLVAFEDPVVQDAGGDAIAATTIADTVTPTITLAQIESIALANNPTLRGLTATMNKAAGYRNQVGLRANPTVGYQGQQLADQQTDQHTAFIEQEFVTGGKLELNRRVLGEAVQAQGLELEAQRLRISTDVRAQFFQALAAQRRIELIHEFQSVADKGFELAELRRQALEGSKIDVLQAKVQKNEIDLAYQQAQIAFSTAWKSLTALAGTTSMPPAHLDGELPESDETLDWNFVGATIVSASPELQAAQTRVRQARAYLERQGVQAIPNLTMQMAAGVDNGTNSGLINLQVGAPIPVFNQNQGNIAAARADYCRAVMEVQRIENSIAARLANVSQDYQSSLVAVAKYSQEILPNAAESMSLAELAYKSGETNFIQVLVARRTYFESNLQYIAAQSQLAQARARVDGFVLSGGLDPMNDQSGDDSLRGLTFSQQ